MGIHFIFVPPLPPPTPQNENDAGQSYNTSLKNLNRMHKLLKVVFPKNLIAHEEFSIISEVFLCLSYFFHVFL